MKDIFAHDILQGLTDYPKHLPSKYFYDAQGDLLFQQIMKLPEYYLTNCEFEIFEKQKEKILQAFTTRKGNFHLIELGAGDGYKTKVLLKHLCANDVQFEYVPVDISQNVLNHLQNNLKEEIPSLQVAPVNGDYFHALEQISEHDRDRKVVLFLGSNIGNFNAENAHSFIKHIAGELNAGDLLFLGVDLKKEPSIILDAYNDKTGVTKAFNLNLLTRINSELGGNFDIDSFKHYPVYNPESGECKSYLLSLKKQDVYIEDLNLSVSFEAYESIHTEISKKYAFKELQQLAENTNFKIIENFTDQKGYFVDALWEKK